MDLRLPLEDVEPRAGDHAVASAAASAASSTTGPRAVFTRYASSRIAASASASIRWRVSGVSGQCSETMSARASSSSSSTWPGSSPRERFV